MHPAILAGLIVAIVVIFFTCRDSKEERKMKKQAAEELAERILVAGLAADEQDHMLFYQVEEFRGDFPTDS